MLQQLFDGYPGWVAPTVSVGASLVIAYLIAETVARLVRIPLVRVFESAEVDFRDPIVRRPVRVVRSVTFVVVGALLALPAFELAGYRTEIGMHPHSVAKWFLESGLRIALILLLAYSLVRIVAVSVARLERDVARGGGFEALERAKRVHTLGNLVKNIVAAFVGGAALMMALRELNIDVLPLLTGAGIAGLAVGFGAQTLVKDVISGFFVIFEDQVRVGDAAVINGVGGAVQEITLRTIVLRDVEGTVHVFPNGSINTLANRSKDFAYFVIDVSVAYKEDPDRVMQILRDVAGELRTDSGFGASILEPLEVMGVDNFAADAVVIKARIKTMPLKQWEVGREFRRRIKLAFDQHGVEIPFPQRTLHITREASVAAAVGAPPAAGRPEVGR